MTLVAALPPLAAYAVVFQTIVYLALPRRHRFTWAPMVTGVVGAVLTVLAGVTFGFGTIGLGAVDPLVVAGWAILTFGFVALIGTFMLTRPQLRSVLADPRIGEMGTPKAIGQILIRIPIMTALIEEAFFRGVLYTALMALYPPGVALWIGAGLFGLWHIGPGIDQAQGIRSTPRAATINTVVTVVATTVAGAGLVWLRMETGSIWAPVAVHALLNMTMAIYARLAAKRIAADLVPAPVM